ncbi:hypothetical protein [Streptomyces sp. NPDC059819]|uniref:hypothetical protein n=1 Tax=Streptomyces sp. NPDC059819 TaxID=3346963 RepID=UPI0036669EA0
MKTSVNAVSFSTAKKTRVPLADLAAKGTDPAAEKKIARVVPASGRPLMEGASFNSSL